MIVSSFVIARNEESLIRDTLLSIINQTIKIDPIVLVDDGSTDKTPEIGRELGCHVISLPYHKLSYVGRPELASRLNSGLSYIRKYSPDYVLQMGGDHILPADYVESIISRMGYRIKVASGSIRGVPRNERVPLGSGRIVDAKFWEEIGGLQYPVSWGFESWLLYKTEMMGYEVKNFKDILTEGRPVRMTPLKAYYWGRGSYALGTSPLFALKRCLFFSRISLEIGVSMCTGYLSSYLRNDKRLDVANFVRQSEVRKVLRTLRKMLDIGN